MNYQNPVVPPAQQFNRTAPQGVQTLMNAMRKPADATIKQPMNPGIELPPQQLQQAFAGAQNDVVNQVDPAMLDAMASEQFVRPQATLESAQMRPPMADPNAKFALNQRQYPGGVGAILNRLRQAPGTITPIQNQQY